MALEGGPKMRPTRYNGSPWRAWLPSLPGTRLSERRAHEDVPDHLLCAAARNSSDAWWRSSVYAAEPDPRDIEDLSE